MPFLIITLTCVFGVEGGYLALERFVIDPVIQEKTQVEEQGDQQLQQPRQRAQIVKKVDYGVITKRNLFGTPPQAVSSSVSETPPEELEATSLDVVLMGTVGGDGDNRAIILNKRDRKQEIYSVGDNVQGAIIKEILRGKVILNLDGRDEMLDMSEAAQYAPKSPSRPVAVNPAIRTRRVLEAPSVNGADQSGTVSPRARIVRPTRRIIRPQPADELAGEQAEEVEEPGAVDESVNEVSEEPGNADELATEVSEEPANAEEPVNEVTEQQANEGDAVEENVENGADSNQFY